MSIHIEARKDDIADRILLPGDPLRAQHIAEQFFESPQCFNKVRNMFGFTGTYKGQRVSVMGTGMGMPSLSIYVNELIKDYGVTRLIRVGTCGSFQKDLELKDVVLALSASTDSAINVHRFHGMTYAAAPSFNLLLAAYQGAKEMGLPVKVGKILSEDLFYGKDPEDWKLWARYGVMAVEMETSELYTLAALNNVEALSILTVSDSIVTGKSTTSEERAKTFNSMIQVGLSALISP